MGNLDYYTTTILLSALTLENKDEVADVYKALCEIKEGGPSDEVAKLVTEWIGRPCKIKYTDYTATVESLNTSDCGFYNGGRYPVYAKINEGNGDASGMVFEYQLDQIILTEE